MDLIEPIWSSKTGPFSLKLYSVPLLLPLLAYLDPCVRNFVLLRLSRVTDLARTIPPIFAGCFPLLYSLE